MADLHTSPRIYVMDALSEGVSVPSGEDIAHYLRNVMRLQEGSAVRLFNGKDGEFSGRIEGIGKKTVLFMVGDKLRIQPKTAKRVHLYFAPLKKERLDFLIEKSVELGVTDLHPVLTQNSDIRKINGDRIALQIIEAAEQCERLDIPMLHPLKNMETAIKPQDIRHPVYAALERTGDAPMLSACKIDGDCGVLIGPAGGFSDKERQWLSSMEGVTPVSLGQNILRSETAAIATLSLLSL